MLKHFRVPGRLAVKLKELGIPLPVVLRRAGLPRDTFDQTRILVSTSELFAFWRAIEAVSSDPLIGLKLGVENSTQRFHPMGSRRSPRRIWWRQPSIWPATKS